MRLVTGHAAHDVAHITCNVDDVQLLCDAAERAYAHACESESSYDRRRYGLLARALMDIGRAMEQKHGLTDLLLRLDDPKEPDGVALIRNPAG